MKKIGIYSGTFDPIHNGHISFAREAMNKYGLDKVFFLPEPRPRRKQGVKAFNHRVEMLRLALLRQSGMGTVILKHSRFSVQYTLPLLLDRFAGTRMYLLIGDDALDHLVDWPNVEALQVVNLIIGVRKKSVAEVHNTVEAICRTKGVVFRYNVFQAQNSDISSSYVRKELRHGKKPVGLNSSVQKYISANNLYSISGE